jgi:hypothetical protein
MSALIIAIYIWLGGYFGVETNAATLAEEFRVEYTQQQESQNSLEWEIDGR